MTEPESRSAITAVALIIRLFGRFMVSSFLSVTGLWFVKTVRRRNQ